MSFGQSNLKTYVMKNSKPNWSLFIHLFMTVASVSRNKNLKDPFSGSNDSITPFLIFILSFGENFDVIKHPPLTPPNSIFAHIFSEFLSYS